MKEIPQHLLDTQIKKRVHIKPNELRLGNFAYTNTEGKMCGICFRAVQIKNYAKQYVDSLEPIPITKEWLEWLGICVTQSEDGLTHGIEIEHRIKIDKKTLLVVWTNPLEVEICHYYSEQTTLMDHIRYIHQLQNLYFALTGQELVK